MRSTTFFLTLCIAFSSIVFRAVAQPPQGYYDGTENLTGESLKAVLHNIIKNHQPHTYAQLWQDFILTDKKPNEKVWDMYSDIPGGTPAYEYTFVTDQCGNYSHEGDCYNREHSWPASWFGSQLPMYTDLFHLYPVDGYVNNKRGNFPYAKVGQASWTSTNGSRLGNSVTQGYSGTAFEPIDEYKGDLARGLMYMSVRYAGEDAGWPGSAMTAGAELLPWARALLLQWHEQDPVSNKEITRNNTVFQLQNNRNPFIDHPEFAALIWDPTAKLDESVAAMFQLWPNPASESVSISFYPFDEADWQVSLTDLSGRSLAVSFSQAGNTIMNIPLTNIKPGCYLVTLSAAGKSPATRKLIIK
ncbi:MAG: endonuclease [Bacteroidales bacterium]|nr:endonuclease [Bacteroidales bacterium]